MRIVLGEIYELYRGGNVYCIVYVNIGLYMRGLDKIGLGKSIYDWDCVGEDKD